MNYSDDMEPVPEGVALVMAADELCAEDACYVRVPELAGREDDSEVSDWIKFLLDLDDTDSGTVDAEDSMEVDGVGWIEDTRGRAVYIPSC